MKERKSYKLALCLLIFVFGSLLSEKGSLDNVLRYDFSLNKQTVLSFIQANNNSDAFKTDKNSTKHNFSLVISESRITITDDNNFTYADDADITEKHSFTAWDSYKQNYSCNRVLHPPLSKLMVLLI